MIRVLGEFTASHPAAAWLLGAACVYLAVAGVWLSVIDVRSHRLPDRIVLPSYPAAGLLLAAAAVVHSAPERLLGMLAGAVILTAGYFLLRLVNPAGLGLGDVKFAGLLGLYLGFAGWGHLLWGTMAAFVLGGLWGVALIITRRGSGQTRMAFGPFMLAGAGIALLV